MDNIYFILLEDQYCVVKPPFPDNFKEWAETLAQNNDCSIQEEAPEDKMNVGIFSYQEFRWFMQTIGYGNEVKKADQAVSRKYKADG